MLTILFIILGLGFVGLIIAPFLFDWDDNDSDDDDSDDDDSDDDDSDYDDFGPLIFHVLND